MSLAKNMGENICKNVNKNLSAKYNQKLLHHAKQVAADQLKNVSKRAIQKTAEATGDFIGNETDDAVAVSCNGKITKSSRTSTHNSLGTVKNEQQDKETHKERYISPE